MLGSVPVAPVAPVGPVAPVAPVAPVNPVAPVAPVGPVGPGQLGLGRGIFGKITAPFKQLTHQVFGTDITSSPFKVP